MADEVWAELGRRHGMSRRDRATWTNIRPSGLGGLRKRKVFDALATPAFVGEPGDMVFLHPHLLHAPAPNHSTSPRLMATGGLAY
jgi:hypothetical protein